MRMLIRPKRQLIRDNDTELAASTQIRLRSTRRFQRVELPTAATETVNPIVSGLAKAQWPALLAQIRPKPQGQLGQRAAQLGRSS